MVYITFLHNRDVFTKNLFNEWVYRLFPSAKFKGTMYGSWYPTICVSYEDFRKNNTDMPVGAQSKIAKIEVEYIRDTYILQILEHFACGISEYIAITNLHPEFEEHTGREKYGNKVEEVYFLK